MKQVSDACIILVVGWALTGLGCVSVGDKCWISPDEASGWRALEEFPEFVEGDEFRVSGVYRSGFEFSLLAVAIEDASIPPKSIYSPLEYCVRVSDRCRSAFHRATDLPGDYVGKFSNLAHVTVIARYNGKRDDLDCPLGRVAIIGVVSADAFTRAEAEEAARE